MLDSGPSGGVQRPFRDAAKRLTLITALITALLSLVNAVGVLLVNGKVDRLARRVEWLTGRVERLTGRVDALEGTVQSMVGAIAGGARGGSE